MLRLGLARVDVAKRLRRLLVAEGSGHILLEVAELGGGGTVGERRLLGGLRVEARLLLVQCVPLRLVRVVHELDGSRATRVVGESRETAPIEK